MITPGQGRHRASSSGSEAAGEAECGGYWEAVAAKSQSSHLCGPPFCPLHLIWLQVLDEIGVDMGSQLSSAPKKRLAVAQQQQEQQQAAPEGDLLASSLAALR